MRPNLPGRQSTSYFFARVLVLSVCIFCVTAFRGVESTTAVDPVGGQLLADFADKLAPEYGQHQMDRLARRNDRDSLIAAIFIGSANDPKASDAKGHAEVVARLVRDYPDDMLAMYTAALVCHKQLQACLQREYQAGLLRLAPDNAIHYLLVANAGEISGPVLHAAATATSADTHFSEVLGIVRSALKNQPAPSFSTHQKHGDLDLHELALMLRRNEVLQVPWPNYSALMAVCSPTVAMQREDSGSREDCTTLGLMLFSERGNNMVSMMVGSSLVRRFAKGTEAASSALALRRQYVWLSEQGGEEDASAVEERLQDEEVQLGEWAAYKHKAARAGIALIPPAGWVPRNPKVLVLPEDHVASELET